MAERFARGRAGRARMTRPRLTDRELASLARLEAIGGVEFVEPSDYQEESLRLLASVWGRVVSDAEFGWLAIEWGDALVQAGRLQMLYCHPCWGHFSYPGCTSDAVNGLFGVEFFCPVAEFCEMRRVALSPSPF